MDIGTNCGVALIILAKQNPLAKIYGFEPDPFVYEIAKENVKINNLSNVLFFNKAMHDKPHDICKLSVFPHMSGANTIVANEQFSQFYGPTTTTVDIPTESFDNLVATHAITSVDLLKIDCEGAEYGIIYASETFKTGIVKNIVGEFHNTAYTSSVNNGAALIDYCKQYVSGLVSVSVLVI